jgi:hypothetical protein
MATEGTLGLARSQEPSSQGLSKPGPDESKDELQHRMEVARESISHTVDEIKDTVVTQYESVKETISKTLDWHEQVKRSPVIWSAGALGAGFVVGYGIAAIAKGETNSSMLRYEHDLSKRATVTPSKHSHNDASAARREEEEEESPPGVIERLKETPAYDRLKQEAAVVGNRFVDEISKKAQQVILPAAVGWFGSWLEGLLAAKTTSEAKQPHAPKDVA